MARIRITKTPKEKKRVRIVSVPSAAYGGYTNGYGHYSSVPGSPGTSGYNQMAPEWNPTKMALPPVETARQLKAVPRDEANIEAEKGETVLMPNKGGLPAHYNIGGNRHSEGGTPLNVSRDSFVFSDTKKMRIKDPNILAEFGKKKGSYTPAELAKKYDINKYRKVLQDPDSDHLDVNTAEKMIANYELKLAKLALVQESKKGFPQGIPAVAMPYLATFNISPDSVLPLKAEEQQVQDIPYEDVTEQAKYGMQLPKAQIGNQGYVDISSDQLGPQWDFGSPSFSDSDPFKESRGLAQRQANEATGYQPLEMDPGQLGTPPSVSSEGTLKTGLGLEGETAANWGIAGMRGLAEVFSRDERRNAEEDLVRRFKAENIFASREDRDRGDWTPNQGYFRPDQKSTGRFITGAYGGQLPKAQVGIEQQNPAALLYQYRRSMEERAAREEAERAAREEFYGKKRLADLDKRKEKVTRDVEEAYKTLEQLSGASYLPLQHRKRQMSVQGAHDKYMDALGKYYEFFPPEPPVSSPSTFGPGYIYTQPTAPGPQVTYDPALIPLEESIEQSPVAPPITRKPAAAAPVKEVKEGEFDESIYDTF